jgi:hypothetical protein
MRLKLGRWIDCKYCYKAVKPKLGGIYQVLCSECGAGLTPDFYSAEGLQIYMDTEDYELSENCKEEIIARDEIFKAREEDPSVVFPDLREIYHNCFISTHISQLYLREISKTAIKKYEITKINKKINP